MTQATKSQVEAYFENLAIKCKALLHTNAGKRAFLRLSENASSMAAGKLKSPYVKVSNYGMGYKGDVDVLDKIITVDLDFLMKPLASSEQAIDTARDTAEGIMEMFITRMQNDSIEGGNCALLEMVDFDRLNAEEIGPVNQNEYGWRLSIPFMAQGPIYDETNFIE